MFYVNRYGRSVQQIRQEAELRAAIDDFLDKRDFSGKSSTEVRSAIQEFVRNRSTLKLGLSPAEPPALWWRIKRHCMHSLAGAAVLLAPVVLVLLPFWLILLRRHENSDVPTSQAPADRLRMFRGDEDLGGQNQILAIGLLKPGWFRRLTAAPSCDWPTMRFGTSTIAAPVRPQHNTLCPLGLLDDNKRMFFSSNYDGSLESYMNDFIDKAAWGLNAFFSNGDGFPRTAYLFCGGITDEQAYKRFFPPGKFHRACGTARTETSQRRTSPTTRRFELGCSPSSIATRPTRGCAASARGTSCQPRG